MQVQGTPLCAQTGVSVCVCNTLTDGNVIYHGQLLQLDNCVHRQSCQCLVVYTAVAATPLSPRKSKDMPIALTFACESILQRAWCVRLVLEQHNMLHRCTLFSRVHV